MESRSSHRAPSSESVLTTAFILSVTQLLLEHAVRLRTVSERTERSSEVSQYLDLPAVGEERGQG